MATKTKSANSATKTLDADNMKVPMVETGCLPFDLAMTNGKGLPLGSSILLYAMPGVGKTTLFADVTRNLLRKAKEKDIPFKVLFVDVEGSTELLVSMGLKPYIVSGDIIVKTGQITFGELSNMYEKVLAWHEGADSRKLDEEYKDVKLIIVDSLCQVQSQALLDKDVDDGDFGSNAKERARFYPKFLGRCKTAGVTSMFITQVRVKQGAQAFEDPKRPACTDTDIHNCEICCKLSKGANTTVAGKKEVKTTFGVKQLSSRGIINIKTSGTGNVKNRFCTIPDIECLIEYGKGVINSYTVKEMLMNLGYIKLSGSRYCFGDEIVAAMGWTDVEPNVGIEKVPFNQRISANTSELVGFLKSKDSFLVLPENSVDYGDGLT